jgi:hypothetical protein
VPSNLVEFSRPAPKAGGKPNADAAELYGAFKPLGDGQVLAIQGQAPTTALGEHPSPWPAPGVDMQYWSMCDYLYTSGTPLVANTLADGSTDYGCRYDTQVARNAQGDYTIVVGTEDQRAAIESIPGATFLPLSTADPTTTHILALRNLVPNPNFAAAIQNAPEDASPTSSATAMGAYYPQTAECPLATLTSGGFAACQAASAASAAG